MMVSRLFTFERKKLFIWGIYFGHLALRWVNFNTFQNKKKNLYKTMFLIEDVYIYIYIA